MNSTHLGSPPEIRSSNQLDGKLSSTTPKRASNHPGNQSQYAQIFLDSSDDDVPIKTVVKNIGKNHLLLRTPSRHARNPPNPSSHKRHASVDSTSTSNSSKLFSELTSSWSNVFEESQSTSSSESAPSSSLPLPSQFPKPLAKRKEKFKALPIADHSIFFDDLIKTRKCFQPTGVDSAQLRHCIRQFATVGIFPDTEWLLTLAPKKTKAKVLKVSELLIKFVDKKGYTVPKGHIGIEQIQDFVRALVSYKAALLK